METVTNAATAVKNAIWGTDENHPENNETAGQEPLSGETGKGTATEPYDKGNQEPAASAATGDNTTSPTTDTTTPTSAPKIMSDAPSSNPAATGPTAEGQSRPEAGSRSGDVRPTEANANRPSEGKAGGFGTAEPSVSAHPSSGQQPQQKQQGADRPEDAPSGDETAAIKDTKDDAEAAAAGGQKIESEDQRQELAADGKLPHDPNDHSGEPMKMHGGPSSIEEGASGNENKSDDPREEGVDKERNKSIGQEGGTPHDKPKGTGEEYVKSTGLEAEGGDFDATKPGAGREATRLLEEKGIHKEKPAAKPPTEDTSSKSSGGKGKESKVQKLKDKLHIGSGKSSS